MTPSFAHGYALLIGVTENQVTDWALPDVAKDITALADGAGAPGTLRLPRGEHQDRRGAGRHPAGHPGRAGLAGRAAAR